MILSVSFKNKLAWNSQLSHHQRYMLFEGNLSFSAQSWCLAHKVSYKNILERKLMLQPYAMMGIMREYRFALHSQLAWLGVVLASAVACGTLVNLCYCLEHGGACRMFVLRASVASERPRSLGENNVRSRRLWGQRVRPQLGPIVGFSDLRCRGGARKSSLRQGKERTGESSSGSGWKRLPTKARPEDEGPGAQFDRVNSK